MRVCLLVVVLQLWLDLIRLLALVIAASLVPGIGINHVWREHLLLRSITAYP